VSPQSLLPQEGGRKGSGVGESSTAQQQVEEFRARHARTSSTTLSVSPQSLLPQEREWLRSRGASFRNGCSPPKMGARPHKWVRALIKWVRALMMMGALSLGWGRALIKWGRALLERGLFQKCHNEL